MDLYTWFHDDITWCGNDCSYTKCYRNMQNKLSHEGLYSAAMFKGTETCPLTNGIEPIWQQGKAYCGICGCRIPLKIKAHYCHKCGVKIKWIKKGE